MLSDRSGPAGAVEERLVPATAAGPVVLSCEEVGLAELPAAPEEDVGMLIEVVTQAHGAGLHRPDHHEGRQGHRVVTAIDVLRSSLESAPGYTRSEEHTSELQSPVHLVCRLLL